MQTTAYYNLNIVEGTDIVNPLTVDNPNYEKIDEEMHKNAVSGVTLATEIANATVHAINRENSECSVIRFIATSNWKAGDTVTVDGVPVTALLPSGETLPDGAYVINANVLCILTGTNLTVYVERNKVDNASEIAYNDTNVANELDKLNSNLKNTNALIYENYELYVYELNISYDLTDYIGVLITYQDADSVEITHSVFVKKDNTNIKIGGFNSPQFGSNIYRTVSVDNSGVRISASSATDYKSAFIVPKSIIAIKNLD